ncbi:MAG: T9SS type A sorting domain-containing protein [Bacteroidales bacterium]|nr:T9SS type A sorting domain-containing protein [Bacteroidales bacterium]
MKNQIFIIIVSFATICSLNSQNFQTEYIISYGYLANPSALFPTDIDNDGDFDILTATYGTGGRITWVENLGGAKFGLQHDIHIDIQGATDVFSIDLDGDGDQDILAASQMESAIYWYENSDDGNFSEAKIISDSVYAAQSVFSIDLDNDGDNDVLSAGWTGNEIAWYENLGNGVFGIQQAITTNAEKANSVFSIDLDNDGYNDVLSSSSDDNKIAWYKNFGDGNFGEQQVISTAVDDARCVYATDMDLDGDNDVLSASFWDGKIAWYENLGDGIFSEQKIIIEDNGHAEKVFASDLDNDGDFDVLSASYYDQNVSWYENLGDGTFGEQNLISEFGGSKTVYAVDLDNDGDNDIISYVFWYKNMGEGEFSSDNNIITAPNYVENVVAVDVDNDLDMDIFYSSKVYPSIGWYENTGNSSFTNHYLMIPDTMTGASKICPVDLNKDGLIDIIAGFDDEIVLFQQDNGGVFNCLGRIGTVPNDITALYTADFDKDGDMDILASSEYIDFFFTNEDESQIVWLENINGKGWVLHNLYSIVSYFCTLRAIPADLDNDGDCDILSRNCNGDNFLWFENSGGGDFTLNDFEIPDNLITYFYAVADLDSDNDNDIVATALFYSNYSYPTIWLENDGLNNFNNLHYVDEDSFGYRLLVEDLDKDEDLDIVVNKSDTTLGFYYNDGNGNFVLEEIFEDRYSYAFDLCSADLDNDQDQDILYISYNNKMAWIENQHSSSINEPSDKGILIFPNPAKDHFTIKFPEENKIEHTLILRNVFGVIVLQTYLKINNERVDISALATGVYFCTVIKDHKSVKSGKLLISY